MKQDIDRILAQEGPLKARQIASKLGLERKKVSAFLHANSEEYQQNENYEWNRTLGVELLLPNKWIAADEFEKIFRQAGSFLDNFDQNITVTLSQRSSTMIECTARLLALVNQLADIDKRVTIDFTQALETASYLDRAGFFDHLDHRIIVLPERPEESAAKKHQGQSDTLVEFGVIEPSSTNDALIQELTSKFVQLTSQEYEVPVHTIFGELIGNVFDHSNTSLPGFAGLQKYGGRRKHIQAVVSDSGAGIAKTLRPALREHYPSLYKLYGQRSLQTDIGLVKEAIKQGRISRYGGARGLGFEVNRVQAVKFNARTSVRQERFCLDFIYEDGELLEIREQTGLSKLLGTHMCFDFYLD